MKQSKVRARIISEMTGYWPVQAGLWVTQNLLGVDSSDIAVRSGK